MADREQSSQPVAGIFAVLALAVGALIVQQQTLVGSRPSTAGAVPPANGVREDVHARLWQDPFAAVRIHLESPNGNKSTAKGHGEDHAPTRLFAPYEPDKRLHVIVAMSNGGPYAGASEQRRRQRYAIVSALGAVGYAPDHPEHIGYVRPERDASARSALPEFVPFERFTQLRDGPGQSKKAKAVVLYFDEDALDEQPLKQLVRFHDQLIERKGRVQKGWHWSVVGPASTAGLAAMVRELPTCESCDRLAEFRFLTAQATASDRHLVDLYAGSDVAEDKRCVALPRHSVEHLFCRKGLHLSRLTATDDQLAQALVEELVPRAAWPASTSAERTTTMSGELYLVSRKLGQLDRIVLVSEWDTPYGRQLPIDMRDSLLKPLPAPDQRALCPVPGEPATRYSTLCPILFFSYFRGLDGTTWWWRLHLDFRDRLRAASAFRGGEGASRGARRPRQEAARRAAGERASAGGADTHTDRLGGELPRRCLLPIRAAGLAQGTADSDR